MSHAIYHAQSSARRFGGHPNDYLPIHEWFDASKAFIADARHRALRHHAQGIFWCEEVFGRTITNSSGRQIPVRLIGEQHVMEDFRRIPTLVDWFTIMPLEEWMYLNVTVLPKTFRDGSALPEVAAPQTDLRQQAEQLTAHLAVIHGQLYRETCVALLTQAGRAAHSVETRLHSGQVQAHVLDEFGTTLQIFPHDELPFPCQYFGPLVASPAEVEPASQGVL